MAQLPMGSQLYLGRGLNSTTGRVHGTALIFDDVQTVSSGQQMQFSLESVSSSRELSDTLNVSASASFKAAWGASAEFGLVRARQVNSYYTYALIRVAVLNAPRTLRNPRLKPEAAELLTTRGWEAFAAVYGWEYVDGYVEGGSYYALLEIQTRSESQQLDVKTKLSGYYGAFSGSAEFKLALQEINKTTTINVFVTQTGGNGEPVGTTLDEMLVQAKNFPAIAAKNPVPVVALTAEYRDSVPLPNVPAPDSLARIQQRNTLQDLGKAYLSLRDYKANLEFIRDHLSEFDEFRVLEPPALEAKRTEVRAQLIATAEELDEVVRRAAACADDPAKCETYVPQIERMELPTIGGTS